jgi:hypothetical protein
MDTLYNTTLRPILVIISAYSALLTRFDHDHATTNQFPPSMTDVNCLFGFLLTAWLIVENTDADPADELAVAVAGGAICASVHDDCL